MSEQEQEVKEYPTLSDEESEALILEHKGWCDSIARSVARAWNLDWQLDGLDGAALEALIFCARRFSPARGVPFKGYARKRIHEAATEAARQSRGWTRGSGSKKRSERLARQISSELLNVFPELRSGFLPGHNDEDGVAKGARIAIQQLLIGASVVAARQGLAAAGPDDTLDFKRTVTQLATLHPVHQTLMWKVYWDGHSLRGVASSWETDELNVIREHKVLLEYLQKYFTKATKVKLPRVRPGLRHVEALLDKDEAEGVFKTLLSEE